MAKASDNPFPSVLITKSAAPATPSAGTVRLFVDTTDGALKKIDEAGAIAGVSSATASSRVYAHRGTVQSLAHNVATAVDLTGEDYDTDAYHDTVTNINRLTIPAGFASAVYDIKASVQITANATGMRTLNIRKNGANLSRGAGSLKVNAPAGGVAFLLASADVTLVAGDYVDITVTQTSGAALDLVSATVSMRRV